MADIYGTYNFNRPGSDTNALHAFTNVSGQSLQLNYAELSVSRAPEPVGFRFDIGFGNVFSSPAGLGPADPSSTTNPTHAAWHRYLQQAYLSFKVPVGKGLIIDAGKFVTHMGAEVIESRDNWNYSRSLLFTLAIPYYHTGLRLSYPLSDSLTLGLHWLNGWNTFVQEGTRMRTGGLQLTWNANAQTQLVFNYVGGQTNRQLDSLRHVADLTVTFKPTERLSAMLNLDLGYDTAGTGATWWGAAAYLRYQFRPWLASGIRYEYYSDGDGFTTTVGQSLWEVTATLLELTATVGKAQMLFRLEYRHDESDRPFFETESVGLRRSRQDIVLAGVVGYF
jgi:hypothetical protein